MAYPSSKVEFGKVPADAVLSGDIVGLRAYNGNKDSGARSKDLVVDHGKLVGYILSVGGFLGMGEHYVEVEPSSVAVSYDTGDKKRVGVCRDFAHLAVTLCRCMDIPTRYANGFLGDIGVPADSAPMDYNAWLEVYLDHRWYTFDARHNVPRIGRITGARGRDVTDIPLVNSFGLHTLNAFEVWTEEMTEAQAVAS